MIRSHRYPASARASWAVLLGAVALVGGAGPASATAAFAEHAAPTFVFDESRSLAIEAARTRLALFVDEHPVEATGDAVTDAPECPLSPVGTLSTVASLVASQRSVDLRLQLDPWLGGTVADPELRPESALPGEVEGIPIVRCDTSRPSDEALTRPGLFTVSLGDGVSFGDVARLSALEGVLRTQPAEIGGEMVGSCLGTADTSVCVVLWHSRNLVVGLTLEGPPDAVNTSTAGATLMTAVPLVIDTLAVVIEPAPVCSADSIRVSTDVALLEEPACHDGWAFGRTEECPSDLGCDELDVFHVEPSGWIHHGMVDIGCTESLTRIGMTVVTAREIAPTACDEDDPSLDTGTIRPGDRGARVAALQIALANLGYDLPVDGRYGPLTQAAVVDFQVRNELIVDGITGRQTQAALGI
jgi:hypothetical protein